MGIIGVDKETKDIVWKKQWPDVAQQHCPVVTNAGTLVAFCNGNIRPLVCITVGLLSLT